MPVFWLENLFLGIEDVKHANADGILDAIENGCIVSKIDKSPGKKSGLNFGRFTLGLPKKASSGTW